MLSHLDRVVFANRCEVIEIIPSQRYVYPIFKNGRSSLFTAATQNNWRIRINEQIQQLESIDVIIRNPEKRLPSGINTYIQTTLRDNPSLDPHTVEWFALNYAYLNNHYCPQFMWLINLSRFTSSDVELNFLSMKNIAKITTLHEDPGFGVASAELIKKISSIQHTEMYQRIDQVLFDSIDQSMTFKQLWQHIQVTDPAAYDYVIGHAQQLLNTTYVLS
jgi:hypothetical protein